MAVIASRRRRSLIGRIAALVIELIVPAILVVVWWIASANSTSLYFPPLSKIVSTFVHTWFGTHFSTDFLPSLEHLAAGFVLATATGVLGGLILGSLPAIADACTPILEFVRSLPGVALVPAALLLLGIGTRMQVIVIASATIWPILLNTIDGVRNLDPMVLDVARSYRIRWLDRLPRLVLRAASPQIVAGMRTALSVAIIMVVFSEQFGSTNGIGYQLLSSQRNFEIREMWATMILLGLLGYFLNLAFRLFERGVLGWHRGMRQTAG